MRSVGVITKLQPTRDDLRALVESIPDGCWVSTYSRGVVDRDDGRVYIDIYEDFGTSYWQYLDEAEKALLLDHLGQKPGVSIDIHLSMSGANSKQLAREVAELVIEKWGGVVHDGSNYLESASQLFVDEA